VFAVAVADQSYRLENDVIERATKGSDGVEFSLEVQSGTKSTTVWKRQVSRDELGRWIEGTADLRAHRGREVTLILRTKPGARGDSAFDYAFWSGLRFRGRAARSPAHPHVVLLDIDTLRADRVSSYRYRRQTTPRLDRWIREHGVVYLDALAASSWTLPSTASMLTGLAPPQHLVRSMESKLGVDTPSLATYLRAAGYETYSFVANSPFFRNGYGFDQGFDVNDSTESIKRWADPLEIIRERRSERPLYVFLHTYMVHAPYKFDRRFLDDTKDRGRSRFEGETITYPDCISAYSAGKLDLSEADKHYINALYDAGVARMDDVAGSFLEQLEEALDGQPALVFVTADHGEEFWEHQGMSHGQSLHHELLRVPLLVRFPEPRADRVSREPVTLLDIVPTVLDYVGMEPSAVLPGASLRRPIPQRRVRVAEAGEGHYALQIGVWKLIRGAYKTPRWKPDPLQLFNLAEDPGELINKAATEPDRVADLERLWTEFLSNHRFESKAQPSEGLGAEDVESLRALGYIQ
jgi:arylsulfatase A-like enzyme